MWPGDTCITLAVYTGSVEIMKIPNLSAVNRSAEISKADQVKDFDII